MRTQIWTTRNGASSLLLEVDATVREGHSFSQEITAHPVEEGADVVDHVRRNPDGLTLECVHSNTPIMRGEDFTAAGLAAAPGKGTRVATAYQSIRSLEGKTFDVVTELRKYSSVALASCDVTRTSATGDVLAFTASFKEVRRVTTSSVRVRVNATHGNKPPNLGEQPPTKTDEATENRSWLKKLDDSALGGFLGRLGKG